MNRQGIVLVLLAFHAMCGLAAAQVDSTARPTRVSGVVVDENGEPAIGAEVDWQWSANGALFRDGKFVPRESEEIWKREGNMAVGIRGVSTDDTGGFLLEDLGHQKTVLILNQKRTHGAVGRFGADKKQAINIRLQPLVRIDGTLNCDERQSEQLGWTGVYVRVSVDENNHDVIAFCGSYDRKFSFALPPGDYELQAYGSFLQLGDGVHTETLRKPILISANQKIVHLGPFNLALSQIARAMFAGRWGNLADYYGKQPPAWHVTDARGVEPAVSPKDYHGKWVLINFWGFG